MEEKEFEERVWKVYFNICDKQDLDLKVDTLQGGKGKFVSAFNKACKVVAQYYDLRKDVEMTQHHIIMDLSDDKE